MDKPSPTKFNNLTIKLKVLITLITTLLTGCEPKSEIDKCVTAQVKGDEIYYKRKSEECKKGTNWENEIFGCKVEKISKEEMEASARLRCLKAAAKG